MSSRGRKRQKKAFRIGERVNAKISLWLAQRSVVRMAPQNTKRVEDNGISDCQLVGINDNLTGIVDNGIQ